MEQVMDRQGGSHDEGGCEITTLHGYGLKLYQPVKGYRFSVDSLLLAEFAHPGKRDRVADMGTGCGVVGMILARRFPMLSVCGIEVQDSLAQLAKTNSRLNGLEERVTILSLDINDVYSRFTAGSFDFVVSNPPYRTPDSGRLCALSQEALARHEILVTLNDLLDASSFLLRTGGRFAVIYPAERLAALVASMKQRNLEPKKMQPVYPSMGRNARLCLVEGRKCGGEELVVLPPVFIKDGGVQ
jgi:tRNA1Val (adenine37-N6)-methyltransferase